tara:strand:- start:218 stop:1378 length:1161 start_codon:yes stop_codon:yes gene_type:complete
VGGLVLIIMGNNLNHGTYLEFIRVGVSTTAGHVVVQGEGWQADPDPLKFQVPDAASVASTVQAAVPEGTVVQRTFLGGLLNSATNSVGIMTTAIQPEAEAKVSEWHTKLVEGEWLEPGDKRGIILGVDLARTLEVGLGKKVVLMGQGKDDVASRLFRVKGLIRTGAAQVDGFFALVSLESAQAFLEQPGTASQVSLHLTDPGRTDAALTSVQGALSSEQGLEVLGWKDAVKPIYDFTKIDRRMNNSFMAILGLMVALGILNTILMSVMERMREFGVLLALGTPPGRLRRMILSEGLLLGLFAASVGLALGAGVTSYLVEHGVDYTEMMGETMEVEGVAISTVIYASWDWFSMSIYTVVAVFLSVLATAYPAWKAGRIAPVEAMRHQ